MILPWNIGRGSGEDAVVQSVEFRLGFPVALGVCLELRLLTFCVLESSGKFLSRLLRRSLLLPCFHEFFLFFLLAGSEFVLALTTAEFVGPTFEGAVPIFYMVLQYTLDGGYRRVLASTSYFSLIFCDAMKTSELLVGVGDLGFEVRNVGGVLLKRGRGVVRCGELGEERSVFVGGLAEGRREIRHFCD